MAKLSNGFLGDASGKLGNVVFSKWKRINTARAYQGNISDANSPAQKSQRLRMSALQSFLSPLNNNFIKFFNSKFAVNSTPWAKAIKDNMPAVDKLGNIDVDLIKFGNNSLQAVNIIQSTYDPYIDRLKIKYEDPNRLSGNPDFPLVACSMLGVSKKYDMPYTFNSDNLLKYMPDDYFYCEFENANDSMIFKNFFDRGQFWLIPLSDYRWDEMYQSVLDNTNPRPFTPISEVEAFNLDFDYDPIPPSILELKFSGDASSADLKVNVNLKLLPNNFSLKNKISLRIRVITRFGIFDLESKNVPMLELPYTVPIPEPSQVIGFIVLYDTANEKEEQIGRFNRLYYGMDINGIETPYYDALYNYYDVCPLSFKLVSNQLGIFGNVDELCADFISSYKSGLVTGSAEIIDYSLFEIKLMSESGQIIQSTTLNKKHDFYFSGVVPNNRYYVLFSYTPELIEILGVPRRRGGSVFYLTPATVVANHNHDIVPEAVIKAVRPLLANPNNWQIPMESYVKEALFRFHTSNPNKYKKTIMQDFPVIMDGTVNG